jgi:acetoin utilization deacetylase AcuC-like enzyme
VAIVDFDAHAEDDVSGLYLVEQDFAWVTHQIHVIADKYAQGRIVSTLEGGYALSGSRFGAIPENLFSYP